MNESKKNSVLIVDDESSNIMKLTQILSPDYIVYAAKNGQAAVDAAEKYLPDVILLDILMSGMDGYDVIAVIKSTEKTQNIPVIFITGLSGEGNEEKGLILGAADYITKPFNSVIVKLRVQNQVKIINQLRMIERISMIDLLTDLPNRRSFESRLALEWRRAVREQTPFSVLMADVDRFKNYNDTYGHQQGDAALQAVAKAISAELKRSGDFAARWGGEEFIVLLPNTDSKGALNISEQIRRNIEITDIYCADGLRTSVTASIGVNTWAPVFGGKVDQLISGADMALYAAKNGGRNKVCHYKNYNAVKSGDKRHVIFIVDDNAANLTKAEAALGESYRVIALSSAAQMFSILNKLSPDLILLDIEMPDTTGFEAMKQLKTNPLYTHIPVIFLTGLNDDENEARGIELGAVDFITNPFSEPVLLNRIKNHLHIDTLIRNRTAQLVERTEQLVQLQNSIVYMLADLVENRDKATGGHIDRTTVYMEILLNSMLARGIYADEIRNWNLESVISSARLHDIGKIVISDSILDKKGPLTEQEFQTMKTHTVNGERIINKAMERTGGTEFLNNAKLFAAYHHERWDGTGYLYGLKGTEIPLHGRIMAVIDVYDALVSERPYKKAFSHEESVRIILDGAGNHFDPLIVEAFYAVNDKIMEAGTDLPA